MKNLLIADFRRILKDKLLFVILIISGIIAIGYPIILAITNKFLVKEYAGVEYMYANYKYFYGTSEIALSFLSGDGLLPMILPLLLPILLFKDQSSGIIRNKLIIGEKRESLFFTALIENIILTLGLLISCALISFGVGSIFFKVFSDLELADASEDLLTKEFLFKILISICCLLLICSITTLFVCGLKNLPLGIIIPYVLIQLGSIIVLALQLFTYSSNVNFDVLKTIELLNPLGAWSTLFDSYIYSAFYMEAMRNNLEFKTLFDTAHVLCYTLIPLGFACLFSFLGMIGMKNRDIK